MSYHFNFSNLNLEVNFDKMYFKPEAEFYFILTNLYMCWNVVNYCNLNNHFYTTFLIAVLPIYFRIYFIVYNSIDNMQSSIAVCNENFSPPIPILYLLQGLCNFGRYFE
jgi:hypothetical protein